MAAASERFREPALDTANGPRTFRPPMKLRNGKPVWLAHRPAPWRARQRRRGGAAAAGDVAIVGGGITGALVAEQLLRAGLRVTLFDQRAAGLGSTAASTGLLLYQPDASIDDLSRGHSRQTARRVYALGRQAIRDLGALIRTLRISCGWAPKHTLYVASRPRDRTFLRREARRTTTIGFPVTLLDGPALERETGVALPAALLAPGAAQVNALALCRGVLAHCLRNPRFQLHEHTAVRSVRDRDGRVCLRTARGAELWADHVIIAAGYESPRFGRSKLVQMHSTYVIASKPFPAEQLAPVRHLMWETARPYFYLRTTADHRIVFGGQDDAFSAQSQRDRRLAAKTRRLEQQFAALFPALAFKADYAWSGAFAETSDGLPCIGPLKTGSRVYFALGYGGNGITFSQIAARILRDACLGRANPDAKLFGFDRRGRRQRRRQSRANGSPGRGSMAGL